MAQLLQECRMDPQLGTAKQLKSQMEKKVIRARFWHIFVGDDSPLPNTAPGYISDEKTKAENVAQFGEAALCENCDGTGNAFFYHYRECPNCGGSGVLSALAESGSSKLNVLK